MELQLALHRAAVVAATRIVADGKLHVDLNTAVSEAFASLFDTEISDWPEAVQHLQRTADLAGDLVLFASAIQGGRNAA